MGEELDTVRWLNMSAEEVIILIEDELNEMNIHQLVKMLCVAKQTNNKEYTSRRKK